MKNISLFLHRVLYVGNYENEAHFLEMQKRRVYQLQIQGVSRSSS